MRRLMPFLLLASMTLQLAAEVPAVVPALRVGDIFDMRLSGVSPEYAQDFALQFTIGNDGTVNMPFIGEVKAAGLTPTQLERTLQNRLVAGKIFTQPTIIVNPVPGVRTVTVSGGVRAPQRLQWSTDLTLSTAIGSCGGLSDFARRDGIRLVREAKVFGTYNLSLIQKDPGADPKLLPGDQVWIRE